MMELLDRLKAALADRYRIEREIGSGGMATVYLAEDLRHDRQVAIKVLRPDLAATLGPERFHREIKIAARLQHPNILPLLDSGEAQDPTAGPSDRQTAFLYYVMPYIEGQSLRDKVAKEGELPIGESVRLLRDVVDALTEAHAHGVVHRDIKPENILLRGRHALVTDFGVAKAVSEATGREQLTTAGVALGTPAYMAPEQASADPHVDHRVDIYAVGAVAYELLTGRPVFMGTTPQMVLAAHVTEAPQPVTKHRDTVPAALDHLVMRCLEKKPADRWQSAEELLPQLEALATPSGGVTPAETQPVQAVHAPRRAFIAAAVVAVAAVFAAFMLLRPSPSLSPLTLGQTSQVTLAPELELDPALSPDGQMLAYASGSETETKIYVRSVAGGATVAVTEDLPGTHRMPQWSPDGTQILFTSDRGIYVVPQLGGHARLLMPSELAPMIGGLTVGFAVWSPDGTEMAYGRAEPTAAVGGGVPDLKVYVQPVAGGEGRLLTEGEEIHSLSWSPDGRFLAYVSGNMQYAYGGTLMGNLGPSALCVVPAEGGEPVDITGR